MTDRPASWRMPTQRQMEKMARDIGRKATSTSERESQEDLPPEYWQALLNDSRAGGRLDREPNASRRLQRLNEIPQHLLRVACRRCGRTVEIQKADAVKLYGPDATWRNVGQRLLDNTCTQRTGRHEEDGCWPAYDVP